MAKHALVFLRCVVKRFHVFARNNQYMRRGLWVYVANDDTAVVLINHIGRCVPVDNFAEKAILFAHVFGHRLADKLAKFQLNRETAGKAEFPFLDFEIFGPQVYYGRDVNTPGR